MRRSTVVMLVILALVASLYWEMQRPDSVIQHAISGQPTATPADLGYVFGSDQAVILRLEIVQAGGKTLAVDKSTGSWLLLTSKGSIPADAETIDYVVSDLQNMRIMTRLEPAPDSAATGLSQPVYSIKASLADGTKVSFKVGGKTVTQSGYYVELEDGSVVVANVNSLSTLPLLVDTDAGTLVTPVP